MTDDNFVPPSFLNILYDEEQRRAAEGEAIRVELRKGILPTPEPVVRQLIWRVDRHVLMRSHVFAKENKLRRSEEHTSELQSH